MCYHLTAIKSLVDKLCGSFTRSNFLRAHSETMPLYCGECSHDIEHCIDDQRIYRYNPWLMSKKALRAAPNWIRNFVAKSCSCKKVFFMYLGMTDPCCPSPGHWMDDEDDNGSCGVLAVYAPFETEDELFLFDLPYYAAIETAMTTASQVRHPGCMVSHPGDLPCPVCAILCEQDSYGTRTGTWRPALHMLEGGAHSGPSQYTEPALATTIQVFHAQLPDGDPQRTQQRYRQKSLVAFRSLDPAIRRALDTAQRLYFLLRHGRNIQPSFLRVVLNILFFQLGGLIHRTFPEVNVNIWPYDFDFMLERRLARNSVQRVYRGVWAVALSFGVLTRGFPRMCDFSSSDYAQEIWAAMVADGRLAEALLLVLRWTFEDLVDELVAWDEVMDRGWKEHY